MRSQVARLQAGCRQGDEALARRTAELAAAQAEVAALRTAADAAAVEAAQRHSDAEAAKAEAADMKVGPHLDLRQMLACTADADADASLACVCFGMLSAHAIGKVFGAEHC